MERLEEKIKCQRRWVDDLCERGMTDEEFVRENHNLDLLIEQYIELAVQKKHRIA